MPQQGTESQGFDLFRDPQFYKVTSESVTNFCRMHVLDQVTRSLPEIYSIRDYEIGARYRVRTCDPYRVKVVLYH